MSDALARQVLLQIPAKLTPLLEVHKTFKIVYGGRGSAKSHSVAQILLMLGAHKRLRILCVREVQKTIADSSMQVLRFYIEKLGLQAQYQVLDKEIRHRFTGTVFRFTGLRDHTAESIKSFEGYDIVWVEEASSVGNESWDKLIPTIIRKEGAEIWATFNPDDEDDYVYRRFVKNTDPNALVILMNWRDNPWFSKEMDEERRLDKAVNDDHYQHKWEGRCRTLAGKIFKRRWFKFYLPQDKPDQLRMYCASDYAGAPDPDAPAREPDYTEHGAAGLDSGGNLFFKHWWSGQTDAETWIKAMIGMAARVRPLMWFEEKGVILRSQDAAITKRIQESKTYIYRVPLASAGAKADRALGFAARCAAGTVYFPLNPDGTKPEWVERCINQLCAFTGQDGKTDDMVDVCSLLARGLDHMMNASGPKKPDEDDAVRVGSRAHREGLTRHELREKAAKLRHYR